MNKGSGYDGQWYYEIARDPLRPFALSRPDSNAEAQLANRVAYRYRRILYPLLSRMLSLGRIPWLPWTFPLVSILSIGAGVFCAAKFFEISGFPHWYGFSFAALPGLYIALARNLAEPLLAFCLMAAFLAIKKERIGAALFFLTAAHLTHESSAVISLGIASFLIFEKRDLIKGAKFLIPIAITLFWGGIIFFSTHSSFQRTMGTRNIGVPFVGLVEKLIQLFHEPLIRMTTVEIIITAVICLAFLTLLRETLSRRSPFWLAGLLSLLLASSFTYSKIWIDLASYGRLTTALLLLAIVAASETWGKWSRLYLAALPVSMAAAWFWWGCTWAALGGSRG